MTFTRREVNRLLLLGTLSAATGVIGTRVSAATAAPIRMPLKEFVLDAGRLAGLRRGVSEMKKRKPSDPLSWFFQAAIHGVPPYMIAEAAKQDPDVAQLDQARLWNQCPHGGENSANFLPWHRGYTYHFERILRMHVGDDDFALPYWDYADPTQRDFPREFGIQHLNGVVTDDSDANINPLFHNERDFFLCKYEHPFTTQLPLTELSSRAVDDSRVMASPIFFGAIESEGIGGGITDGDPGTRGLMEQSPHDQIHRVVGGRVDAPEEGGTNVAVGSMATPPTAGFDPIFCVHHANMDRLWAKWSVMPGKNWGTLPAREWFDDTPWFFFDTDGKEVNRPRRDYFDYRALGVVFRDEDLSATPLPLPADIPPAMDHAMMMAAPPKSLQLMNALALTTAIAAPPTGATNIRLSSEVENSTDAIVLFRQNLLSAGASEAVTLTLRGMELADLQATGFDVFLVGGDVEESTLSPAHPGYLGPVSMFNHAGGEPFDQTFELGAALSALADADLSSLRVILVPYPLTTGLKSTDLPVSQRSGPLRAGGVVLSRQPRALLSMGTTPQHEHN